jgi:4'-phosphopantetheinyl transferase
MSSLPMLLPREVHVWIASMQSQWHQTTVSALLDTTEQQRSRAFRLEEDRLNYVFAHFALRHILSKYVALDPKELCFFVNAFGKPFLANSGNGRFPEFNISHSGSMVALAFCSDRPVGVDIEKVHSFEDFQQIAKDSFTHQEYELIQDHHNKDRLTAFFRCWTRKESFVKALGKGLSIPLNAFDTSLGRGVSGGWVLSSIEIPAIAKWWVADIHVHHGYTGAITVAHGLDRLVRFEWQL